MRRLLIATKNAHKTAEIQAMLPGWTVTDLTGDSRPAPEETGATFAENACLKALAAGEEFAGLVLADDSGLEVDLLGGAPGVLSARFAGPGASDAENRARLRREVEAGGGFTPPPSARFRCAMALAEAGKVLAVFEGRVEGSLIPEERGSMGFGYDALFVPEGGGQTFAEIAGEQKNLISHRARALEQVCAYLDGEGKKTAEMR